MKQRLAGKSIIVTGAGTGLGKTSALLMAEHGARIAIIDNDSALGQETLGEIRQAGGEAFFLETDVTDPAQVQRAIDATLKSFGKLDVIFNNAGGPTKRDGLVTRISDDDFWSVLRLNFYGPWLFARYGVPVLKEAGGGSIINVSSATALESPIGMHSYQSSKGAILAFTRACASDYAGDNIRVNAILPGLSITERTAAMLKTASAQAQLKQEHPLGIGGADAIAEMAVFLASDESRGTSGQFFTVNLQQSGAAGIRK
jgi:NAD(P)-dependent dehydrogenase (short-subunit alcohol dehydrogenase family)